MLESVRQMVFCRRHQHAQMGKIIQRQLGLRRDLNVLLENFGGGNRQRHHQFGKTVGEQVDFAAQVELVVVVETDQPDGRQPAARRQRIGDVAFRQAQQRGERGANGGVVHLAQQRAGARQIGTGVQQNGKSQHAAIGVGKAETLLPLRQIAAQRV